MSTREEIVQVFACHQREEQQMQTADERFRYHKLWRRDRAKGILRLVDAAEVRHHLAMLSGQALSMRSIAAEAKVSVHTVSTILGGQERVTRKVAEKILSVRPKVPDKASKQTTEPFVPKIGAVRRIQALLALGWPYSEMDKAGAPRCWLICSQQGRWITRTTHDRVAAMYRTLAAKGQGPSQTTRGRAARRGYLTPAHWDDIDLDPAPDEFADEVDEGDVDEVAVLRRMDGDQSVVVSRDEQAEVVRRLRAQGTSDIQIEKRTGINVWRFKRAG